MPDILLTTLNAKYAHCAFGLRYLLANLGDLQPRARLLEFDINQRTLNIAEMILTQQPRIVGLGVYVWNAVQSAQLVTVLKRLRPELIIILGGPEVSYETESQPICQAADYVITGEADFAFADLCRELLVERASRPFLPKIQTGGTPVLLGVALPYDLYTETDITHRVIYVEASRGCPFECEFCLSSLDMSVRNVPPERFLPAMQALLDRGTRQFKFVDRTFNLNLATSAAVLQFFLDRYVPGLFLHFEMIPDRLPESLQALIRQFQPGALQLEVGIQTFNEHVTALISRRQDNAKAEENLRWLREQTGVHIHADLIVGLPGEDVESFAAGFDRLVALRPQEIQVGMLKRLRGAPIKRHDAEWAMTYGVEPPYEILQTKLIDFFAMQRLRRFARYWDLVANSGNFLDLVPLLWGNGSPFAGFMRFSDWLYAQTKQTHAIAQPRLRELVRRYLVKERQVPVPDTLFATTTRASTRQARHLARS